jgi:ABC-type branched-subunit amino acid transport system substrate-binding protein
MVVLTACGSSKSTSTPTTATTSPAVSSTPTTATPVGSSSRDSAVAAAVAATAHDPLLGTPGSGLTRGITSSTIKFGCIYEAANYSGMQQAIEARFGAINSAGGLFGRKLTLVGGCQDDGNDANDLQIAQRLVEQDGVFAIITATQGTSPALATYLDNNQVPFIGWGFDDAFCGKRWAFGFDGCLNGPSSPASEVPHPFYNPYLVQPMVEASGLAPSAVKAAIVGSDSDGGRAGDKNYSTLFQHLGASVVYAQAVVPVPGPTTDYTPFVQATLAKNPNVVLVSTQFSDVGGLTAALKAAGFKGDIMNFVAYVPGLLSAEPQLASSLSGTYVLSSFVPQEQGGPYISQTVNQLKAVGGSSTISFGAALGFVEADELSAMVKSVGSTLNTKTFDQTINGGTFQYTPSAADGPCSVPYPGAHFFSASGAALLKVSGESYQLVKPFTCYSPFPVSR